MDQFNKALDDLIKAMNVLSEEWEKLDAQYSNELSENYPFEKDFQEVVSDVVYWRSTINK